MSTVALLETEMVEVYTRLERTLERLSDDEFSWEPVPGCWKVYRDDRGRWTYDYEEPCPEPAPLTTIGWRLVHVALCKVIYHEWAFGPGEVDFTNIENPGDVATSMSMLREGHRLLVADLAGLKDRELEQPVLTNWGETWPAWRIFWTMIDHDAHHGAEIAVLRELHRHTPAG